MADTKLNIIVSATDKASGKLKGISGALGGIAKVLGIGLAGAGAITAGIGGLAVAIGKLSDEGAKLQGIEDAFQGFAGDQAGTILKNMNDLSNGMITQTDLMKSYNKAAQLVGVQFANELPDALGALGKVAAATGEDMNYLLDSLVTGVGRQSKQIIDNLGITVKSMDELLMEEAQRLGISEDAYDDWKATLDETTKRMIFQNHVMEMLTKNTANLKEFVNPVQQIRVAWQNFGDTFKKVIKSTFDPLLQRIAPQIMEFFDLFGRIISGDRFEDTLRAFEELPKPLQFLITVVKDVIDVFKAFSEGGIERAIGLIGFKLQRALGPKAWAIFVKFKSVFDDVVNFIKERAIPWIKNVIAWIGAHLPIAIRFLANIWETILYPAFQRVSDFVVNTVIPKFQEIWDWLQDKIPAAIETAREFWEEKLQPAIEGVWNFINENLIPIFQDVWDWLMTALPEASQALQDLWEGTFKETIAALGEAFGDLGETIFEAKSEAFDLDTTLDSLLEGFIQIADFVGAVLNLVLSTMVGLLRAINQLLSGEDGLNKNLKDTEERFTPLKDAVDKLIKKINDLAEALRNLTLPDWLVPGSPTPFELGLRGINDAMDQLNRTSLPKFSANIAMGGGSGAIAPSAAGGAVVGGGVTINLNAPVMGFSDKYQLADELGTIIDTHMRRRRG